MRQSQFILLLCALLLAGMSRPARAQHDHLQCGTPDREETPEFRAHSEAMARKILELRQNYAARKTSEAAYPNASEYVIPMVVHVIYGDGDRRRDSVSYQQVASQLVQLFNDYRNVPGTRGYNTAGVDTKVEFSLATRRPNGEPFSGIEYYYGPDYVNFRRNDHNDIVKQQFARQWDPERYMNIWLVNSIVGSRPEDRLGGYANFPDMRVVDDGCVIINSTWGTVGTSVTYDATATHELGHILNLYHPFQGGCGNTNCLLSGDQVCDTPPVQDLVFKDPASRLKHCQGGNPDIPEWPRLYMEYTSPSALQNFFSPGQLERMQACLSPASTPSYPHRYRLYEEGNVSATGAGTNSPLIAGNFWSTRQYTCAGAPITFLDYTMGQPVQFQWSFEGGTPATSTDPSPSVTWSEPGSYDVSLIVVNGAGARDTVTKSNFITVMPAAVNLPFNYNFDGPQASFLNDWTLENLDAGALSPIITWQRNAATNSYGRVASQTGCLFMNYYSYNKYGEEDGLISPQLNRVGMDSVGLSFDYSYANFDYENNRPKPEPGSQDRTVFARRAIYSDTLSIMVSTDCGQTWSTAWRKGGDQLRTTRSRARSTTSGAGGLHEGTAEADWETIYLDLTPFIGESETFLLKFYGKSGFGNNLFLDEISIRDTAIGVSRPAWAEQLDKQLYVAPNPATESTNLHLSLDRPANLGWQLFDLTGRRVASQPARPLASGEHQIAIDLSGLPAGIYSLTVEAEGSLFTRKIVRH